MINTIKSTHGTLNMTSRRLSCRSCRRRLVRAGRRCAPSWVDADETWSSTGALNVMAAALPARAGLRYLLTAVRQALKHRSCWLDKPGLLQKVVRTVDVLLMRLPRPAPDLAPPAKAQLLPSFPCTVDLKTATVSKVMWRRATLVERRSELQTCTQTKYGNLQAAPQTYTL